VDALTRRALAETVQGGGGLLRRGRRDIPTNSAASLSSKVFNLKYKDCISFKMAVKVTF
jgi:hypothetical protein